MPLILRRGPRFDLTAAGEERNDGAAGKVRLLSISGVQSALYDEFLAEFHQTHPRVELEIEVMRSSDIISSLLQKTATAGLGLCRIPQAKLEQRQLLRQRYAFFCGPRHRLFGCRDVPLEKLQGENFVSFVSDQLGGNLSPLAVFRDQKGFTGRIVASSSSFEEIRRLVCAGRVWHRLPAGTRTEQRPRRGRAVALAAGRRHRRCGHPSAVEPRAEDDHRRGCVSRKLPAQIGDQRKQLSR